jgi:hypothetical protein
MNKSINELAKESFKAGYTFSQFEFTKRGGSFGDYYYNVFKREVAKLRRENETVQVDKFKMKNSVLINKLYVETEILKNDFLEHTRIWAIAEFARIEKFVKENGYKIEPNPDYYFNLKRREGETEKEYYRRGDRARALGKVFAAGSANFVAAEIKLAFRHYQDSIVKLAGRIEKKGLDQSKLTMKTGRVAQNIETVLTDGSKTVRAWTIIASGAIQRPHYRYLVK